MFGFPSETLEFLPVLGRIELLSEREAALHLKSLQLGGVRFLSGEVRLRVKAL